MPANPLQRPHVLGLCHIGLKCQFRCVGPRQSRRQFENQFLRLGNPLFQPCKFLLDGFFLSLVFQRRKTGLSGVVVINNDRIVKGQMDERHSEVIFGMIGNTFQMSSKVVGEVPNPARQRHRIGKRTAAFESICHKGCLQLFQWMRPFGQFKDINRTGTKQTEIFNRMISAQNGGM